MSEIEKMYRTAKVVPSHHYCNDCKYDMSAECPIRCPDDVAVYPPFTAEKQIELCKWLIKNYHRYVFDVIEADSFETDLAKFMNEEWQDLTEEEKQQVKEILG